MKKLILILCLHLIFITSSFAQCNNVALNKPSTATGDYMNHPGSFAFDGNCNTWWNAGGYATQSIQVDLQGTYTINNINLIPEMLPNGNCTHNIYTAPNISGPWTLVDVVTGFFSNGQLIERCYSSAPLTNVGAVKVTSTASPSWISWAEIGVFAVSSASSMNITYNTPLTFCQGDSVVLTSSAGPSYLWSNGATTQSITVKSSGMYHVSVGGGGCISGTQTCTKCQGLSDTVTVVANPAVVPSVTIFANPGDTICSGTAVTFTANDINGGTAPTYQWTVNGTIAGTDSTYSSSTLNNGDHVRVVLSGNATCASTTTAADSIIMRVTNTFIPSVSIAASPGNVICAGTPVTFTATPDTNENVIPTYQWQINGTPVGTDSNIYTSSVPQLNNNDVVSVIITSNATCAQATTDTATVNMIVNPIVTPTVSIAALPGNSICPGTMVTFSATALGGGNAPAYQWVLNGNNVGSNSDTYSNNSLNSGDSVKCIITSSLTSCLTDSTASSNSIVITISQNVTAGIVSSPKNTICQNTIAHLAVSGAVGSIQWQSSPDSTSGFTNISGATTASYTTPPVSENTFYKVVGSTGNCNASSEPYEIHVVPAPIASFTEIVIGHKVNFNGSASMGATSYFWDFGDDSTSTVVNPVHTFDTVGVFHVCLTVKNNSNCNFTLCQNVTIFPTGVNNINDDNVWQLYPDPFSNQLYINLGNATNIIKSIVMYDVLGRTVFYKEVNGQMENPIKLEVPDIIAGVYFLKIKTADSDLIKSVIKQ